MTVGFDMTGSGSIRRLDEMPGSSSRRGKMLGGKASWGKWTCPRSIRRFWSRETCRLYVQAKLAEPGELQSPFELGRAFESLLQRMAFLGIVSVEPAWVTRLDVAVDAECRPEDGKLLLDALEAARLPNGWRTRSVGVPARRSTSRREAARRSRLARTAGTSRPSKAPRSVVFVWRLKRRSTLSTRLFSSMEPAFVAEVWLSRFGTLAGEIERLGREAQAIELANRVAQGELRYGQGERLSMFLDLESLGLVDSFYPPSVLSARRQEARKLGFAPNERGLPTLKVDLDELLSSYVSVVADAA